MRLRTLALTGLAALAAATPAQADVTETRASGHLHTAASAAGPHTVPDGGLKVVPLTMTAWGGVTEARVTLKGVSHPQADDLDVLLVAPSGERIVLMSDAGGATDTAPRDLTFVAGAERLPGFGPLAGGTYGPTDYSTGADGWGAGCTDSTVVKALDELQNASAGGTWKLCVRDDAAGDLGSVAGWELTLRSTGMSMPLAGTSAGVASEWPSAITFAGMPGVVRHARVRVGGLQATRSGDLDLLLVAPDGRAVTLMSDAGDGVAVGDLVFDDAGPPLPAAGNLAAGTYRPTNHGAGDPWPAPAPAGDHPASLAALAGAPANGAWQLFAHDDDANGGVALMHGWSLELTAADPQPVAAPPVAGPGPQPRAVTPRVKPGLKLGKLRPTVRRSGALRVRFTLSRKATVRLGVERRVGRRYKRVVREQRASGRAGVNTVALKRRLAPGRYRLTVRAGKAKRTVTFRVRRARRR